MVDDAAAACGVVSPSANDPPLPPEVAAVLLPSGGHKANALRQIVAAEDGGNVCLASLWMFVPPHKNNNFYIPPTLTTMNRERKIRTVSHKINTVVWFTFYLATINLRASQQRLLRTLRRHAKPCPPPHLPTVLPSSLQPTTPFTSASAFCIALASPPDSTGFFLLAKTNKGLVEYRNNGFSLILITCLKLSSFLRAN